MQLFTTKINDIHTVWGKVEGHYKESVARMICNHLNRVVAAHFEVQPMKNPNLCMTPSLKKRRIITKKLGYQPSLYKTSYRNNPDNSMISQKKEYKNSNTNYTTASNGSALKEGK